jgi:predicted transcriptional regulator
MTKLLQKAFEAVQKLSDESQDAIAHAILSLTSEEPETITAEDLPHVLKGLEQADRGEFATPAEVEEVFRRFDR